LRGVYLYWGVSRIWPMRDVVEEWMAGAEDEKTERKKPGRKLPPGAEDRRQFLAQMNADVIRAIKVAAAEDGKTASELLEQAARELLQSRKPVKKKR
jgi:transcription initiation factor IIF auxiliary subunit